MSYRSTSNQNQSPSPRRGGLSRAFGKAAKWTLRTLAIVPVAYAALVYALHIDGGRKLTPGERQMVYDFFGDKIDTAEIRIFNRKAGHPSQQLANFILGGNKHGIVYPFVFSYVDMCGEKYHADDYSNSGSDLRGFIMHEFMHIRQNQSDWASCVRHPSRYGYVLVKGKDFKKYGEDEQADMVQDYERRFLCPDQQYKATEATVQGDGFDDKLKETIEKEFPEARKTRLRLGR